MVKKEEEKKEHPIVTEYKAAYDISEDYASKLSADILKRGFVGQEVNKETIDDIVGFLHSKEVVAAIKKSLGSRAKDLSDEELLSRYGLPKHMIKETLSGYESITSEVILGLIQQLSARLHGELVSHHPSAIANVAYEKGDKVAKGVVTDLYKISGGDQYAAGNEKTIENLVGPDKIQDHVQNLYQNRELQQEMARHSGKTKKAVYKPEQK